MKRYILFALFSIMTMGIMHAQAPKGFNYQAVIRNEAGALMDNRQVSVRLTIRHRASNGDIVYQYSDHVRTNPNGLINIVVGDNSIQYDTINWGDGPYYLVSEVDPADGENYSLMTTQKIMSVPYSEYARVADHVSQQFVYDESDPKFQQWNYEYDSLINTPTFLSDFTNDLQLSFSGDTLYVGTQSIWLDVAHSSALIWSNIGGVPENLTDFHNDLQLSISGDTLYIIGGDASVSVSLDSIHTRSLHWNEIIGHPTNISQFHNNMQLSLNSDTLNLIGDSTVSVVIDTLHNTIVYWNNVSGHPTNINQFHNNLQLSFNADTLNLIGDSTVSVVIDTLHNTIVYWDNVSGHPTNISQLNNDLQLSLSNDTLYFIGGDASVSVSLDSIHTRSLHWNEITGKPYNISQFHNNMQLSLNSDTLNLIGDSTVSVVIDTLHNTIVYWNNVSGHPTNISQFHNDLQLSLSNDTLYLIGGDASVAVALDNINTDIDNLFYGAIGKNYVSLAPKTKQTPSSTVTGKFVGGDGIIRTNASFNYEVYPVESDKYYAFDGGFSGNVNIPFIIWFDSNGDFVKSDFRTGSIDHSVALKDEPLKVPDDAAYAYMNVQPSQNLSAFYILSDERISVLNEVMRSKGGLPSGDLNDVRETGTWILYDSRTYTNKPQGEGIGFLRVTVPDGKWGFQEFYSFSGGNYYKRRFLATTGVFESWIKIGGQTNVTNNYEFNSYPQTVSVTASPTIITDANQYLASTGDATDRTNDILTLLNQTGVCRLGPGLFYVSNLVMPANTSIIGSGKVTEVRLATSVTDGFAIKLNSECLLSSFRLEGLRSGQPTSASTVGTRHGILWQGEYTQTQSAPLAALISDLFIQNFEGGGITCYDTGYGTYDFISANNVLIRFCDAGLNISYWSEFHKFTNVRTYACYYGCINNGGNNVFVNCDFSSVYGKAFVMDNSQGQSPNNSHGSCVGCVFNHTASNTGIGIEILNCHSGFIFDGCQIFYSQINIEDSDGVVFNACNGGQNNCNITIDGGGAIIFSNCMWEGSGPIISITDNSNVHFNSCYIKSNGNPVGN